MGKKVPLRGTFDTFSCACVCVLCYNIYVQGEVMTKVKETVCVAVNLSLVAIASPVLLPLFVAVRMKNAAKRNKKMREKAQK